MKDQEARRLITIDETMDLTVQRERLQNKARCERYGSARLNEFLKKCSKRNKGEVLRV